MSSGPKIVEIQQAKDDDADQFTAVASAEPAQKVTGTQSVGISLRGPSYSIIVSEKVLKSTSHVDLSWLVDAAIHSIVEVVSVDLKTTEEKSQKEEEYKEKYFYRLLKWVRENWQKMKEFDLSVLPSGTGLSFFWSDLAVSMTLSRDIIIHESGKQFLG